MTEKRFIVDGNMVRDIEGKIPTILTHNKKQLNEFLDGLNELHKENQELKKALLFYLDVATAGCSSRFYHDMNKWCQILLDCSYDEANERYGDFKYAERWELDD